MPFFGFYGAYRIVIHKRLGLPLRSLRSLLKEIDIMKIFRSMKGHENACFLIFTLSRNLSAKRRDSLLNIYV